LAALAAVVRDATDVTPVAVDTPDVTPIAVDTPTTVDDDIATDDVITPMVEGVGDGSVALQPGTSVACNSDTHSTLRL
jgi:hypothetical protein